MLPSKFANKLPEAGDKILARVASIEKLQAERNRLLEEAGHYLAQIAIEERELAQIIKKQWTKDEIAAASA